MDMELLKGALDESMDILRASVHDEMQNIHLELVRQFHIQEHGFAAMLQQLDLRIER
jgi:protein NEDD1